VQPYAALNARAFRTILCNSNADEQRNPKKGTIDGDLVELYCHLSIDLQLRLARMIGLQAEQILDYVAVHQWQTLLQ